jgi:hypothetical protein
MPHTLNETCSENANFALYDFNTSPNNLKRMIIFKKLGGVGRNAATGPVLTLGWQVIG